MRSQRPVLHTRRLKALDTTGKLHHQYEFLDPYFVEGQHVTVHAVTYVPGRYLVVVSEKKCVLFS